MSYDDAAAKRSRIRGPGVWPSVCSHAAWSDPKNVTLQTTPRSEPWHVHVFEPVSRSAPGARRLSSTTSRCPSTTARRAEAARRDVLAASPAPQGDSVCPCVRADGCAGARGALPAARRWSWGFEERTRQRVFTTQARCARTWWGGRATADRHEPGVLTQPQHPGLVTACEVLPTCWEVDVARLEQPSGGSVSASQMRS